MNPKTSVLFIDDDSLFDRGGVFEYMTLLEEWGYEVEHQPCPEKGKEALAKNAFDIVFVDYLFHNATDTNGGELGKFILANYPMTQAILMTGRLHEEDTLNNSFDVGFHAPFDKEHASDEMEEKLRSTLAIAKKNFLDKAPKFDEKAFKRYEDELDTLNHACKQNAGSLNRLTCTKSNYIVQAANILWATGRELLSDSDKVDLEIHRLGIHGAKYTDLDRADVVKRWKSMMDKNENGREGKTAKLRGHGVTESSWTQRFQLWEESGGTKRMLPKAIIPRDLILSKAPGHWKHACSQFQNLAVLVDYFKIREHAIGNLS
jgi:DNA-binding response OmpR family regulator